MIVKYKMLCLNIKVWCIEEMRFGPCLNYFLSYKSKTLYQFMNLEMNFVFDLRFVLSLVWYEIELVWPCSRDAIFWILSFWFWLVWLSFRFCLASGFCWIFRLFFLMFRSLFKVLADFGRLRSYCFRVLLTLEFFWLILGF
jgi:hypothetical protein